MPRDTSAFRRSNDKMFKVTGQQPEPEKRFESLAGSANYGEREWRNCGFCSRKFLVTPVSPKRFCDRSCAMKDRAARAFS